MKVIIIHPTHDDVTRDLNRWASSVLDSVQVGDDLAGASAAEANLRQSLLDNPSAELVGFYGHGEVDLLVGHGSGGATTAPIIHIREPGVRPSELSHRNLYAVACHAGAELGPALASVGCSFVGYDQKFAYAIEFEGEFARVVNKGLVEWANVAGKTGTQIGALLKDEWAALRKEATQGPRKGTKSGFLIALAAHWNHGCVCSY